MNIFAPTQSTSETIRALAELTKASHWTITTMKTQPPLPTPVELALIAAPMVAKLNPSNETVTDALDTAYRLWDAAACFLQEKERERRAQSEDHDE